MSEYWKSQPKKFCQYCKCWIADNKPSVEFHERGKNHKENVSLKIAEMQKKSIEKAKQEDRQSKEFAAMEKAALKAYEEDMKRLGIEPEPAPQIEAQPPAHPPAQPPAPAHVRPQPHVQPLSKRQEKKLKKSAGKTPQQPRKEGGGESWKEGKSDDGNTYYYSTLTGESRWDRPEGFRGDASPSDKPESSAGGPWMEAVSPDGFTYYYNTETGESSWEKPSDGADKGEAEAGGAMEGQTEPSPSPQLEPPGGGDSSRVAGAEGEDPKQPLDTPTSCSRKLKDGTRLSEKSEENVEEEDDGKEKGDEGDTEMPPALPEEEPTPAKKPRKNNPYGVWEKIQEEEDPYKDVDLQLPKVEVDPASTPTNLPPEPKAKFRERKITSLGVEGGSSTFRKRKTENGKSRSLRQRGGDDD